MKSVGNALLIDNESELKHNLKYNFYFGVMDFVKTQEKIDNCMWFFESCYINDDTQEHFVIFKSYKTKDYENYILSIKITKENDKWLYSIQKKDTE